MARWLIQCGRSDVTGKIKMDIMSREEDGDVEGVHGIRRLVFTVSECDWLPLEWALGRICSFGWWLYSTGFPKWGNRVQHYFALRELLPLAPCSNHFSASVGREILVASTRFDQFPPGHPTASLAGTQGRKDRSDVLWIRELLRRKGLKDLQTPAIN